MSSINASKQPRISPETITVPASNNHPVCVGRCGSADQRPIIVGWARPTAPIQRRSHQLRSSQASASSHGQNDLWQRLSPESSLRSLMASSTVAWPRWFASAATVLQTAFSHVRRPFWWTRQPHKPHRVGGFRLRTLSFRTERLTDYPQLVRMRIEFEGEELMIDIGVDYRSFPPVATPDGLVLDQLDLAGDKLLAFVTRREPRDLTDLTALEARHGLEELCRLATEKDPMFRPAKFLQALEGIENDYSFVANHAAIARWRTELAHITPAPKPPDFDIDF